MSISPAGWSPTIRGESLGSHHRLFVRPQEAQDGSQVIRLVLANPRTSFTSYEGRRNFFTSKQGPITYHFDVPKDLVAAVLSAEKAAGRTGTVTPPDQQGLCHITVRGSDDDDDTEELDDVLTAKSCSSESYITVIWGAASDTALSIPAGTPPAGTSYQLDKRANGDGTWDLRLLRIVTTPRMNAVQDEVVRQTEGVTVKQDQHLGISPDDVPPLPTKEQGKVHDRNIRVNDDCSRDIRDDKTESHLLEVAEHQSSETVFQKDLAKIRQNLRDDETEDLPEREDGKIASLRRTVNVDGTSNEEHQTQEAIEQVDTGGQSSGTTYETLDGDSARNLVEEPDPEALEAGKIKEFRKTLNEFGRWDKDGSERTANTVADSQKTVQRTHFETLTRDTIRNATDARADPSQDPGKIVSQTVEKSEFPERLHDTIETREAQAGGSLDAESETAFERVETAEKRNQGEGHEAVIFAPGTIEEKQTQINDYGLHDNRDTKRTAKPESWSWVESDDGLTKVASEQYRNAEELPDAEVKQTIQGAKNDYGLYDYIKRTFQSGSEGSGSFTFTTYGKPYQAVKSYNVQPNSYFRAVGFKTEAAAQQNAVGEDVSSDDVEARLARPSVGKVLGWFRWKYNHTISVADSLSDAVNLIEDGESNTRSGYSPIGGGRFLVDVVTVEHEETGPPAGLATWEGLSP